MDKKYTHLFNVITDAISDLEALRDRLIAAQQATEEMYLTEASANEVQCVT